MTNPFKNLNYGPDSRKKSVQWYQAHVRKLAGATPEKLVTGANLSTQILPGHMYMFFYDPKFKDVLPYYDRFPLVLPFRKVPGGFYGINLHYLPYVMRFKLLGALHEFANDAKLPENKKIKISWDLLNSVSTTAPVNACVKHYLNDHVQSRFLRINYTDWLAASQLPVERFVGADKQKVWQDSRKKL